MCSTVVMPKQKGGPNSCNTLDEIELFEFVSTHGLMVLGWIHTHPSQTAFLSSVDLHTQHMYQNMLPEAIAIVCSVKYMDCRSFRLTDPVGMSTLGGCKQQGFHPHKDTGPPMFEDAAHMVYDKQAPYTVVDFR